MKYFIFALLTFGFPARAASLAYQLQHYNTAAAVCVGTAGNAKGADVSVQNCSESASNNGLWTLKYAAGKVSSGRFQLSNANGGLCITRSGGANTTLDLMACGSSTATDQFFSMKDVGNGVYALIETTTNLCLSGYPSTAGTRFILAVCDNTPKQGFHFNQVTIDPPALAKYAKKRVALTNSTDQSLRSMAGRAGLYFGSMIDPSGDHFWDDPQMRTLAVDNFNLIEPGVQLKWSRVRPNATTFNFTEADKLFDFAVQNNMRVRGHTLAWGTSNPDWLTNGNYSPAQLQSLLVTHIQTVMSRYKTKYPGRILAWDVVNEPMGWNNLFNGSSSIWSKIGTNPDQADYVRLAFRTARATDPSAVLCLNDYENEGSINPLRSQYLFNFVKQMRLEGVPIDCVGFESHIGDFGKGYRIPANNAMASMIAQYASIGVEVQITEFDFIEPNNAVDWNLANTFSNNLLRACLNAPNCTVFNNWGYSQKYLGHGWGTNLQTMLMFDFNNLATSIFNTFKSVLRSAPGA